MKTEMNARKFFKKTVLSSILLVSFGHISTSNAEYDVKKPILTDRQYFMHKGKNSSTVSIDSLMKFDCHKLMDMYDEDPESVMADLELVVLTQLALEGVDVQTMPPEEREALVKTEFGKRLRQYGRLKEAAEFLQIDSGKPSVIPSTMGLCHFLEDEKDDILRQKYHINPNKWAVKDAAPAA